ncbi:MAG: hypothetical protein ACOC8B_02595 [Gemmatimonadota bacterium]
MRGKGEVARERGGRGVLRLAFVYAILLASLTLVVHRQSRALDALRSLDELRRERAVLAATRAELVRELERLESRRHVVGVARRELDMHIPATDEIVLLPWPAVESEAAAAGGRAAVADGRVEEAGRAAGGVGAGGDGGASAREAAG